MRKCRWFEDERKAEGWIKTKENLGRETSEEKEEREQEENKQAYST